MSEMRPREIAALRSMFIGSDRRRETKIIRKDIVQPFIVRREMPSVREYDGGRTAF